MGPKAQNLDLSVHERLQKSSKKNITAKAISETNTLDEATSNERSFNDDLKDLLPKETDLYKIECQEKDIPYWGLTQPEKNRFTVIFNLESSEGKTQDSCHSRGHVLAIHSHLIEDLEDERSFLEPHGVGFRKNKRCIECRIKEISDQIYKKEGDDKKQHYRY